MTDAPIPARLADQVALVTGGGGGIGGATARRLAREGATVVIVDKDHGRAEKVGAAIETAGGAAAVLIEQLRAENAADVVGAAVDQVGPIDLLINNVAHASDEVLSNTTLDRWQLDIGGTLTIPFCMMQAVLPDMVARGRGCIVSVCSVNGVIPVGNPAYSAAKSGLINLTRSAAMEYGRHGIRVNAVSPGTIETDAPTWQRRRRSNPEIFEKLTKWYPVGRVGRPDDIANAIAFLASDEASFINGANLVVDGGLTAGLSVMAREMAGQ